jgi:hypothetical protein
MVRRLALVIDGRPHGEAATLPNGEERLRTL